MIVALQQQFPENYDSDRNEMFGMTQQQLAYTANKYVNSGTPGQIAQFQQTQGPPKKKLAQKFAQILKHQDAKIIINQLLQGFGPVWNSEKTPGLTKQFKANKTKQFKQQQKKINETVKQLPKITMNSTQVKIPQLKFQIPNHSLKQVFGNQIQIMQDQDIAYITKRFVATANELNINREPANFKAPVTLQNLQNTPWKQTSEGLQATKNIVDLLKTISLEKFSSIVTNVFVVAAYLSNGDQQTLITLANQKKMSVLSLLYIVCSAYSTYQTEAINSKAPVFVYAKQYISKIVKEIKDTKNQVIGYTDTVDTINLSQSLLSKKQTGVPTDAEVAVQIFQKYAKQLTNLQETTLNDFKQGCVLYQTLFQQVTQNSDVSSSFIQIQQGLDAQDMNHMPKLKSIQSIRQSFQLQSQKLRTQRQQYKNKINQFFEFVQSNPGDNGAQDLMVSDIANSIKTLFISYDDSASSSDSAFSLLQKIPAAQTLNVLNYVHLLQVNLAQFQRQFLSAVYDLFIFKFSTNREKNFKDKIRLWWNSRLSVLQAVIIDRVNKPMVKLQDILVTAQRSFMHSEKLKQYSEKLQPLIQQSFDAPNKTLQSLNQSLTQGIASLQQLPPKFLQKFQATVNKVAEANKSILTSINTAMQGINNQLNMITDNLYYIQDQLWQLIDIQNDMIKELKGINQTLTQIATDLKQTKQNIDTIVQDISNIKSALYQSKNNQSINKLFMEKEKQIRALFELNRHKDYHASRIEQVTADQLKKQRDEYKKKLQTEQGQMQKLYKTQTKSIQNIKGKIGQQIEKIKTDKLQSKVNDAVKILNQVKQMEGGSQLLNKTKQIASINKSISEMTNPIQKVGMIQSLVQKLQDIDQSKFSLIDQLGKVQKQNIKQLSNIKQFVNNAKNLQLSPDITEKLIKIGSISFSTDKLNTIIQANKELTNIDLNPFKKAKQLSDMSIKSKSITDLMESIKKVNELNNNSENYQGMIENIKTQIQSKKAVSKALQDLKGTVINTSPIQSMFSKVTNVNNMVKNSDVESKLQKIGKTIKKDNEIKSQIERISLLSNKSTDKNLLSNIQTKLKDANKLQLSISDLLSNSGDNSAIISQIKSQKQKRQTLEDKLKELGRGMDDETDATLINNMRNRFQSAKTLKSSMEDLLSQKFKADDIIDLIEKQKKERKSLQKQLKQISAQMQDQTRGNLIQRIQMSVKESSQQQRQLEQLLKTQIGNKQQIMDTLQTDVSKKKRLFEQLNKITTSISQQQPNLQLIDESLKKRKQMLKKLSNENQSTLDQLSNIYRSNSQFQTGAKTYFDKKLENDMKLKEQIQRIIGQLKEQIKTSTTQRAARQLSQNSSSISTDQTLLGNIQRMINEIKSKIQGNQRRRDDQGDEWKKKKNFVLQQQRRKNQQSLKLITLLRSIIQELVTKLFLSISDAQKNIAGIVDFNKKQMNTKKRQYTNKRINIYQDSAFENYKNWVKDTIKGDVSLEKSLTKNVSKYQTQIRKYVKQKLDI